MEFLISIPTSAMKPIAAVNDRVLPVSQQHEEPADDAERYHSGTISIERKLPNSSTSIANMPNTATSTAVPDSAETLLLCFRLAPGLNA